MKKVIIIIIGLIISIAFVTTGIAQDKAEWPQIGRRIIITGCLHRGAVLDDFVLLGVTERPADASEPVVPMPYAIYWLDSTEGMAQLVGKMVEITGTVTSSEANPGTITISIDPTVTLSTGVKLESGKRDITTKKFDNRPRPMGAKNLQSTTVMSRPVYNMAVDDIRAVDPGATGPPCQFEEKIVVLATEMAEPKVEEKVQVIAAETRVEEKIIILAFEDVHFDYDKSTLTKEAQTILKRNIKLLIDNPKSNVRIAGYTSASGTEEYNQKLSERRAEAVEKYLIQEGFVSQERLSTIGYGETNPANYESAPTAIYSNAAKTNMRVLFEIIVK